MMEVKVFPRESFPLIIWMTEIATIVFWFMIGLQIMAAGMSSLLDYKVWIILGKYWFGGTLYANVIGITYTMKDKASFQDFFLGAILAVAMTLWYHWANFPAVDEVGEQMIRNGFLGGLSCHSSSIIVNNFIVVRPEEDTFSVDDREKINSKNIITE